MKITQVFRNLKIGPKLLIGYAVCLSLTAAVGLFSRAQMASMQAVTREISNHTIRESSAAAQMWGKFVQMRTQEYRHVLSETDATKVKTDEVLAKTIADVKAAYSDYGSLATNPKDRANFDEISSVWTQYLQEHMQFVALSNAYKTKEALALLHGSMRKKYYAVNGKCEEMIKWNRDLATAQASLSERTYAQGNGAILVLLFVSLAIGFTISQATGRYVSGGITKVGTQLKAMATQEISEFSQVIGSFEKGDLTRSVEIRIQPLTITSTDEIGEMMGACNLIVSETHASIERFGGAQETLRQVLAQVKRAADALERTSLELSEATAGVSSATGEIAKGSENLAAGSQSAANTMHRLHEEADSVRQASDRQYGQISAAKDEVDRSAKLIQEICDSAQGSVQAAKQGLDKMSAIEDANEQIAAQVKVSGERVTDLNESALKIGVIVQAIGGISDQTNLLALNAAIEAARAGEHGRGFAVVAEEVRKLAEQASRSTREISSLIESVGKGVHDTVEAIRAAQPLVEAGTILSKEAALGLAEMRDGAASAAKQTEIVSQAAESASNKMREAISVAEQNREIAATVARDADEVSGTIESVAAISQETAAGAEELNATSVEVSESAKHVTATAAELRELVAMFNTGTEAKKAPKLRVAA